MKSLIRKAIFVAALCASFAHFGPDLHAQNGFLREFYPDVFGGIDGLTSNPAFPDSPAERTILPVFEAPSGVADNYGQRVSGYLEAPETGMYTFWLSSDDQSRLYLSTDEQPVNLRLIAEVFGWTEPRQWDLEPGQRSAPIRLEAGKRYYIEALMVEGGGGDHLAVRWQLPSGIIEEPIPGERSLVELIPPQISRQPGNVRVVEGSPAVFEVQLANVGPLSFQWFRNDVAITGATNATYLIPAVSISDNGTRYQVRISNAFATNGVLSEMAFLVVERDLTIPRMLSAQTAGENNIVTVTFSERLDPASATNPANYMIDGLQVLSASLSPAGNTVILRTAPMERNKSYVLVANGIRDRASQPNEIEPDSFVEFIFDFNALPADLVYGKAESPGPSSRRTGLVISEIMYNAAPRSDGRNVEFIEIYNSQETIETLDGYRLAGEVDYTFPMGTFISPRSYLVVAAKPLDMQILYGIPRVLGPYTNDLPDSGTLQLLNDEGAVLLEVEYDSRGEWPVAPDAGGPSLVLARPSYGEGNSKAWAASTFVGGSPGRAEPVAADPFRGLVINEFLAQSEVPALDFIELYNYSNQEMDLSGVYLTDDVDTNKFQIPQGTRIPPLGFVQFDELDLNFALSSGGEKILLRNPQATRVIDAIAFGPQARGVTTGRYPDGGEGFRQLEAPTQGTRNTRPRLPEIVINEIMYNPVSGDQEEEYIELFNRSGSAVNLFGWALQDGISFTFTENISIPAGGYFVIAKNAELLRSHHAGRLTTANSIGNFNGSLANDGERVVLERPEFVISTNGTQRVTNMVHILVDEVAYNTGGRWPGWADGGGSSLELMDPNSENNHASAWADSDESRKSSWVTLERRGILDYGSTNFAATSPAGNLHVMLLDRGEALLDNVEVFRDGGTNIVTNPGLEKGLQGWLASGTHEDTALSENGAGIDSSTALHIRAVGRGDTSANRIRVRLTDGLTNGSIATIRAQARWLRGTPDLLLRIHGNYLELPGVLEIPENLGTPGAPNSQLRPNVGPSITDVQHSPILPAVNQEVTVVAHLEDFDGIALAVLHYRIDPSTNYVTVPMSYNGAGQYSAKIPGQARQTTGAFYIEALDTRGLAALFPAEAPASEAVILWGDGTITGNLGTYRLWVTARNIREWERRERASNKEIEATFVYNNERVIYNMGTLYSGSPFHWGGYNSPLGNLSNYEMAFPDDDRFLGQTDFVLMLPSNLGSDNTGVREQTFFWMADQLGQPHNYRRYHHLFLNGVNRGLNGNTQMVWEDVQQPNRDMIEQWYPEDPDGELYKIEDWFEFNDSFGFFNRDADLVAVWTTNLTTGQRELKQERYRQMFRKRSVRDSAQDYSELLELVRAVNQADPAEFVAQTRALIDIDEWLGVIALRHVAGDWDAFGYERGKNMYAYKPAEGKWQLMHWDIAFAFGLGDGVNTDLFSTIETITRRMLEVPEFRRAYYRALYKAAHGPLMAARVDPVIDGKYNALVANGINATSPQSVKNWIAQRREYVLAQLANVSAGLSITSNNGNDFTTNRNSILLTGSAPVNVSAIRVNGVQYPVTWTGVTTWQVRLALAPQQNVLQVQGLDSNGAVIADATDTIRINVTGRGEEIDGRVVFTEIQANPKVPGAEFVELHNTSRTTSYDLSGYRINGLGFVFPSGSVIPPGGFLVVARDSTAFGHAYGFTVPVVGEFAGTLDPDGEALSLLALDSTGTNEIVLAAVRFDSTPPWPSGSPGASLQLVDPSQDASRVGNWTVFLETASPGATNVVRGTLIEFPRVWVNEVQSVNLNGPSDSAGDRDPWVELYNSGTTSVSLSGLFLTDDAANLNKWGFPANSSIGAGQRMVIWLDGEPAESTAVELHTSFRLSPTNSMIALVGNQRGFPAVFDYLAFDQVAAGQSYGAFEEGQAVWRERFFVATPGAPNDLSVPGVQVFINEWMASNESTIQDPDDLDYDDWFELYNASSVAVDLSGFTLTDDLANPDEYRIPEGTVIPARGFLLVWADNENADNGQLHASFRLSADGDTIALFAPDGSVVDSVTFPAQQDDISSGRSPDGGTEITSFTVATPGASNRAIDPDALQFTGLSISGEQVNLTWNSQPGVAYIIQYKNSLGDANWTTLRTVTAAGVSASTMDAAGLDHRFYRIVRQ